MISGFVFGRDLYLLMVFLNLWWFVGYYFVGFHFCRFWMSIMTFIHATISSLCIVGLGIVIGRVASCLIS